MVRQESIHQDSVEAYELRQLPWNLGMTLSQPFLYRLKVEKPERTGGEPDEIQAAHNACRDSIVF